MFIFHSGRNLLDTLERTFACEGHLGGIAVKESPRLGILVAAKLVGMRPGNST